VRELLSVHNIGQRLFAKYVLGLSQGTVSELLSKPKSWDKLTEKGRDSYRKMHAWVWDDQAILLLKTLIPRKGELLRSSRFSSSSSSPCCYRHRHPHCLPNPRPNRPPPQQVLVLGQAGHVAPDPANLRGAPGAAGGGEAGGQEQRA
jgi:hypothetical protein